MEGAINSAVNAFASNAAAPDWSTVFKTSALSPRIQLHLSKVYGALFLSVLAAVVGCAVDMSMHIGGLLSGLCCTIVLIILMMDRDTSQWERRLGLLALFGFLQGVSVSPLVQLAMQIDPAIVATAFLGTCTIFGCFSMAAIYAKRREYLYLGGMLGSACLFMMVLSIVSIFWRPMWMYSIQLYFGLAVFSVYVIYDTQLIVEKADAGSDDVIAHALELFIDFFQIFVRVLIILIQNSQEKKSEKKKNTARR